MSENTFITILPFMVKDLKLRGNELIIFAIIYGFCQDGESRFYGSINYLMKQTGISRRAVIYILDRLVKDGIITREDEYKNDKVYPKYGVCKSCTRGAEVALGGAKVAHDGAKVALGGGAEIAPNKKDIQDISINNKEDTLLGNKVFDSYNSICSSLSKATRLTDKRKKTIHALLKDFTIDEIEDAFRKAESSGFLKGSTGWKADFDWLINKNNLLKVIEGRYNNSNADKHRGSKEGYSLDISAYETL